jgi:hypothetical protein
MPIPVERQSLTKTLEQRYAAQHAGGSFEVKTLLKKPGQAPMTGDRMPIDGNEYRYTVNDFAVKQPIMVTEFLDAQDANKGDAAQSKELSLYIKGFNNRKYSPSGRSPVA